MTQEKVVISIGGSILIPDNDDAVFIGKLAEMLLRAEKKVDIAVVVGGGKIARYYSNTGRGLGGNEDQLDTLGIGATRLNAALLALALGDVSSMKIPLTVRDSASKFAPGRIVVMGGTEPGHTTDAVAAMLAKEIGAARVVNATSVDAVYSDDPRKNPDAVKYDRLTIEQLDALVYHDHGAGKSSVFDPLGVQIAKENKIDIMMVNGRDLAQLEKAIVGEPFQGTFIDSQ
ncbi:putative uridylate kinase [Thermoplasmatales archaeon BRNA1]|nr:putative uridylate kinase [Thermoplasmatales archaeon BRNA1]